MTERGQKEGRLNRGKMRKKRKIKANTERRSGTVSPVRSEKNKNFIVNSLIVNTLKSEFSCTDPKATLRRGINQRKLPRKVPLGVSVSS